MVGTWDQRWDNVVASALVWRLQFKGSDKGSIHTHAHNTLVVGLRGTHADDIIMV